MKRTTTATLIVLSAALAICALSRASHASPPTIVTLDNGLRVVLAPDPAATAADVAVWYATGTRWEHDGQTGVTHLIERLMFRGAPGVPDGEHVRLLVAEGGTVNTSTTPDYSCFWQTVPAEAVPLALRLEAARMSGSTAGADAFEAARRAARADVHSRVATAPAIATGLAELNATVFAGHPYARPLDGRDADLAKWTAKGVEAWRRDHYGTGAATLTVVGRFEPVATLALIRRLFGTLPRTPAAAPPPLHEAPATGERRGFTQAASPARLLLAGWRAPGAGDPDVPALELLAELLGGRDDARLPHALRDEWKLAFASQCGFDAHHDASLFWAVAALDDKADSSTAERVMLDEFARIAREGPSDSELTRARARVLTSGWFGLQTARARAQALGDGLLTAGDPEAREKHLERIAKLTPADLQRVASRVFTESSRGVVWVAPNGGAR